MNGLEAEILVVVVVQMLGTEATGVTAGAEVAPVVVVVGQVELTTIDVTELVVVANERCFVVIVEIVPGDGDPI